MSFGPFAFISLFYAVIGIRVVYSLITSWRKTWDGTFTPADRNLVDQAAFFVLVPISVALHELGHAVAIWSMGGDVMGYGYYGFAGYVSFLPSQFSTIEQTIIAAAGSLVNLVLCVVAIAFVYLWKPPVRASINELLLQFAFISGLNAFVVYPVLDLFSGLNGDWRQMYDSGVPWLTAIIVAVQAATLAGGYWLATNPGVKSRAASRTGVPPGFERGLLGGMHASDIKPEGWTPSEQVLMEAARNVAGGWAHPVKPQLQRFSGGTAVLMEWSSGSARRAVAARVLGQGQTQLLQIDLPQRGTVAPPPQVVHQWNTLPTTDQLAIGLRIAMERAEQQA